MTTQAPTSSTLPSPISSMGSSESRVLWEPRRTLTLEAARSHTRRVRLFQLLLLGVAIACIGLLAREFASQETTVFENFDSTQSVKMENPRYSGRTEDGLPFYLTAKEAIRLSADDGKVDLVNPIMEFYRGSSTEKSVVVAKSGSYDDTKKILNLRADVELTTDDGNVCQTTHARIFAQTKIIKGDEPISCVGAFGSVKGNAYEILDNYETFVFKKGMSAIVEPEE